MADRPEGGEGHEPEREEIWNVERMRQELGLSSVQQLYKLRAEGLLPPGYKLGKSLRFRKSEVLAWIKKQKEGELCTSFIRSSPSATSSSSSSPGALCSGSSRRTLHLASITTPISKSTCGTLVVRVRRSLTRGAAGATIAI